MNSGDSRSSGDSRNLDDSRVTVPSIIDRKHSDDRISAITAYDYTFARLFDAAQVDLILVGDSLGSVIQGLETTIPVTLDEVIYHCRCVTRGVKRALVVGDMPFMSYQASIEQALVSAGRMLKEGGVAAVKLEGGVAMQDTIRRLVEVDIPVVGHVGLTPQSFHRMGGYRVQGRSLESKDRIMEDALAVEAAGAFALVLEGIPHELAKEITERLSIPTIGIGAGSACDGQILVSYDLLGLGLGTVPTFVKKYAKLAEAVQAATEQYVKEVKVGAFPGLQHSFADSPVKRRQTEPKLVKG